MISNHHFYSTHSDITDPGLHKVLLQDLPEDVSSLCEVVQSVMLHIHWADRYGINVTKERKAEQDLRKVKRQLDLIVKRSETKGSLKLPLEWRIFGTCRDFSTLLCALMRHKKIPARPRCGFATYFDPDSSIKYDHWICEYWDEESKKWKMADAQLDSFQQKELTIDFNVTDIPKEVFVTAGNAWLSCRQGKADPNEYGIMDWFGLWFIKGNLVRDLLSLSKLELLPWDINAVTGPYKNHPVEESQYPLMDAAAQITMDKDTHHSILEEFVHSNSISKMPVGWSP